MYACTPNLPHDNLNIFPVYIYLKVIIYLEKRKKALHLSLQYMNTKKKNKGIKNHE